MCMKDSYGKVFEQQYFSVFSAHVTTTRTTMADNTEVRETEAHTLRLSMSNLKSPPLNSNTTQEVSETVAVIYSLHTIPNRSK